MTTTIGTQKVTIEPQVTINPLPVLQKDWKILNRVKKGIGHVYGVAVNDGAVIVLHRADRDRENRCK